MYSPIKQYLGLILILCALVAYYLFDLNRVISFSALKTHHQWLTEWTQTHYPIAVATFMLTYSLAVAISIPGAALFTLVGGFLFGLFLGTIYVVISATLGATLVFLAVRYALAFWVARRTGVWINKMRDGFQQNAFSYLLFLRFIPLFPFWVVNIIPALLGVPTQTYVLATLVGILPGTFVYVYLGTGLNHLFSQNSEPHLRIIFEPPILFPLLALAALSILPTAYHHFKRKVK